MVIGPSHHFWFYDIGHTAFWYVVIRGCISYFVCVFVSSYCLMETQQFLTSLLDEGPVKTVVAPEVPYTEPYRTPSKEREKVAHTHTRTHARTHARTSLLSLVFFERSCSISYKITPLCYLPPLVPTEADAPRPCDESVPGHGGPGVRGLQGGG